MFRPDVILLEIGLPRLNDYEACRRIRHEPWSNGMVLVALTAEPGSERGARGAGDLHGIALEPLHDVTPESLVIPVVAAQADNGQLAWEASSFMKLGQGRQ